MPYVRQEKPGILIFFSEGADLKRLNTILRRYFLSGSPIKEDRLLSLPAGSASAGFGGLTFYCYSSFDDDSDCRMAPAFPFSVGYNSVAWIKDLNGKILWKNWNCKIKNKDKANGE